ncbi:large exoprotein [Microbacterium hominis]|uniref:Large exoprotein n=1 Tax=Microbacterium hominis TaxID=162426 RepID=A0A7D4UAX2_9MICO|nr:large exoprotein [Microbacterium hominis]QKJ18883.1 large exoprotein [Microbacterium hominis]
MGGQVLGGGVIVLVAALLWLVYLLPSWYSRRQFDAAERNAVRLNQALRVLAETSETPEEVRLELTARTALAQQRLARRALAEREQSALEKARVDLEAARSERVIAREQARVDVEAERERARLELEAARARRQAARLQPHARRARARRRTRLALTVTAVFGLGLVAWGAWDLVVAGTQAILWTGVGVAVLAGLLLRRMARIARRYAVAPVAAAPRRVVHVQDVALSVEERSWAPRELPRPLTTSAGSRAAAVLDAEAAHEALRQSALEESLRARVEEQRPPSIDTARIARAAAGDFASMGYVDDAEIEAHVRRLLARRAAGQ